MDDEIVSDVLSLHSCDTVDEVAVTLLDSGRREVVYASCGLLVNLLSDTTCQDNVALNGGLRKYVWLHTNTVSSRPICLAILFVALHLCTYFLSPFLVPVCLPTSVPWQLDITCYVLSQLIYC